MISNASHCQWLLAALMLVPIYSVAQNFQPVSPDELTMTSEPRVPGAPAVILFREVDRNDNAIPPDEDNYIRIKVLTDEGRKYGNIEIQFDKAEETVVNIHARTIQPDGAITIFNGQVFDTTVVKAKGLQYLAKTFTLPNVQVGSILEYSYTINFNEHFLWSSHWVLNSSLYTRRARFTLQPFKGGYRRMSLRRSWQGIAPGHEPVEGASHSFTMDVSNIPALEVEDFMPPPLELEGHVDFIYEDRYFERDPDEYWKHVAKDWNQYLEAFLGKRKAMEEAVAQIVSPSDPPEVKLRKIYDRVQHLRNTTYEVKKTAQQEKREKEKIAENVEQVWKHGYGNGVQLTWLFLGLVRAAGFEAYGVWVSSRRNYFFLPKTMEDRKLNANIVLVKLNGRDLCFDPGAAFTPFGMLTWSETGTPGLRLDKDGGTWIKTPLPQSSESRIEHKARLELTESGALEGKVTVTYTGLEAMYHRLDVRNADDVARKNDLESALKGQIPQAAEVELTNQPDWNNPATPLVAEFNVNIPSWASNAGKRTIFPTGVFSGGEKHVFEHASRIHPIYFAYPYEKDDDVTIEMPAGWQVASVPLPQKKTGQSVSYGLELENNHTSLHVIRKLEVNAFLVEKQQYSSFRDFFQAIRSGDEQQIVLQAASAVPAGQ